MNDKFKDNNSDNPLDKFFTDDDDEGLNIKDSNKDDSVEKLKSSKLKNVEKSKRNNRSKFNLGVHKKFIYVIVFMFLLFSFVTFFYLFSVKHEIFSRGSLGVKAVNLLYDFSSVNELEDNLNDLSDIMTEEVYKKVSVTNSDKALNTYLKFKKNPVSVTIVDSKPGFILYTLDSSSLSSGRKFIFSYTVDWRGRIDSVREMEGIDFYEEE